MLLYRLPLLALQLFYHLVLLLFLINNLLLFYHFVQDLPLLCLLILCPYYCFVLCPLHCFVLYTLCCFNLYSLRYFLFALQLLDSQLICSLLLRMFLVLGPPLHYDVILFPLWLLDLQLLCCHFLSLIWLFLILHLQLLEYSD